MALIFLNHIRAYKKVLRCIVWFVILISGVLIAISCKSSSTARKNENLYKQNNIDIEVSYVVCHENDSVSRLYYSINNKELVYKKNPDDSLYTAELKLFYRLLPSVNSKQVLDTATLVIKDRQVAVIRGMVTGSKTIKIQQGSKAWLDLELRDINRKAYNHSELAINKLSRTNAQNYLLKNTDSSLIYSAYINGSRTVVLSNQRILDRTLFVHYKKADSQLPPPPFSVKETAVAAIQYDSVFTLQKTMDNWFVLDVGKQGIYFLSADSSDRSGCTIYCVNPDFPKVTSHGQMIESIRYITSKDEYGDLLKATNKQDAIEKFWISIGGNQERAKGLIKKYYERVQESNKKFSSYKEGWRSDRGMIYIIFGPPQYVYQGEDQESWIYGNSGAPGALRFEFSRVNNQFSDNDYVLDRNVFFKDPWYLAVDAWREGRIYLDN
jgi:GWxTD domain-containing protein